MSRLASLPKRSLSIYRRVQEARWRVLLLLNHWGTHHSVSEIKKRHQHGKCYLGGNTVDSALPSPTIVRIFHPSDSELDNSSSHVPLLRVADLNTTVGTALPGYVLLHIMLDIPGCFEAVPAADGDCSTRGTPRRRGTARHHSRTATHGFFVPHILITFVSKVPPE